MSLDYEHLLVSKVLNDGAVLNTGTLQKVIEAGIRPDFLTDDKHREAWDLLIDQWQRHGQVPDPRYVTTKVVDYEVLDTETFPIEMLIEEIQKDRKRIILSRSMRTILDAMGDDDPDLVIEEMARSLIEVGIDVSRARDIDLVSPAATEPRFEAYLNRKENGRIIGIPTGFPLLDQATGGLQPEQFVVLVALSKVGKAQPHETPVLTPTGWRKIGDLVVGDLVVGRDGLPKRVLGVHERGIREVYEVATQEGATTRACAEHLWQVVGQDGKEKVLSTKGLGEKLCVRRSLKFYLPPLQPVSFEAAPPLPIHPYVLGLLLGDGGLTTTVTFTKKAPWLIARLRELVPPGVTVNCISESKGRYTLTTPRGHTNPVLDALREMRLHGLKSPEKFIPELYLRASVQDRLYLLQGLMDTDGRIDGGKSSLFATSSPRLRDGVQELVWSLGGCVSVSSKIPTYSLHGEKREGLPAYRLPLRLPTGMCPFGVGPKKETWLLREGRKRVPRRRIISVQYTGREAVRCITVEGGLYVTENYMVTHNSFIALRAAVNAMDLGYRPMFLSFEMSAQEQAERFDAMLAEIAFDTLKRGTLSRAEQRRLRTAWRSRQMRKRSFILSTDIERMMTISGVQAKIQQYRPDLVIVDGVYLLEDETARRDQADWERVTKITRNLKRLTQRERIPMFGTTQALPSKTGRGGKLRMSSPAYSSSFMQDADVIFGLEGGEAPDLMTLEILGGRSVVRMKSTIRVDWERATFTELSAETVYGSEDE